MTQTNAMLAADRQTRRTARPSSAGCEPLHPVHVFDLHCDTLDMLAMRECEPYRSYGLDPDDPDFRDLGRNRCAIDLQRTEDYAWCQCFAVWVPDVYRHHEAYDFYVKARDFFYAQVAQHSNRVVHVRDARQIDKILAQGKTAALLTLENATPINHSVKAVGKLARDGVKMVTLTWNGRNAIGSGFETEDGLTTFAREAIRAFEDERVVLDVSHLNDASFADFLDVARRPFVASHSNSRAVCDVPRNLTDDAFRAIRDAGGLVGLNFYNRFIATREEGRQGEGATFDELAAHAEHFLDLGGEDALCLGSDWDGSDVPSWLSSCDMVGELYRRFCNRFGARIATKVFFTNARDFFVRNETI